MAPLDPDERALSPIFQANLDEWMLREIAEADYGEGADECYPLLQEILRTGVCASAEGQLREVLDLTRWGPTCGGERDAHVVAWMQLFAGAALLQLASRGPDTFCSECETLALFITPALELGEPVARAAASVLAWRFLSYPGADEDRAFLAFAILLLAAHLERRADRGPWLKQVATWVEEEESRARSLRDRRPDAEWLLGLTLFNGHEGLWRFWARRILLEPISPHPREADEALRRLGELISERRPAA